MISLYDILDAGQGQLFGEAAAHLFHTLCVDPAQATPSCLFAVLRTEGGDGQHGVQEALERGATGILSSRPPDANTEGVSVILVKDVLAALMKWSNATLGKLGAQVIGVAGNSAKAPAVAALGAVLGMQHRVTAGFSRSEGRISIPLTVARLNTDDRFVLFELDASAPGELGEMVGAIRPNAAVIPQIGFAYSDRFETPDHLTDEIGLLLEYLSPGGAAVVNYDDDRARSLLGRTRATPITFGIDEFGADMMAHNIVVGTTRTGFDLRFRDQRYVGRWTPLLGRHYLYGALGALAMAAHYGVPLADGLRAIAELSPPAGRMRPFTGMGGALVVDDSADADPATALAALGWLATAVESGGRKIFVFGDLDHMGQYNQRSHRMIGQKAAELADIFITQGADAALAGRAALDHGMAGGNVVITYHPEDVIARLEHAHVTERDLVVVNGSASARMEQVTRLLLASPADADYLPCIAVGSRQPAIERPLRNSWVETDLNAIAGNVRGLKARVGNDVTLFAVVKADAYGHGAVAVARTALLNGASYLAVASLAEALDLRDAGIDAPILVMSYTPAHGVRQAVRQHITVTLYDLDLAREYDRIARENGARLKVHVKVDTGMGRLGVLASAAMPFFRHLLKLSHLDVEGVYTHFSMADEDADFTAAQVKAFRGILAPLKAAGYYFRYTHAANSAGTLASKDNHFNAVRCGLAMYGLSPSETVRVPESFRPALAWRTVIASVKVLPPGHTIGYGNTYRTTNEERVAVIPVGYADGLRRGPSNQGVVLVHGQRAPIRGRVSMEKTVISVDGIPGVGIGDEVTLLGAQGGDTITADEIADRWGTINYEVVCAVLARVPRQ